MPDTDDEEVTPRDEMLRQAIGLAFMLLAAGLVPVLERAMSDPDIGYRVRWHARRLLALGRLRLHEAGMMIETTVGLVETASFLRRNWKERAA